MHTWNSLRKLIYDFELSYVFIRQGEDPVDYEFDNNEEEIFFDTRMHDLFSITHTILINNYHSIEALTTH